MTEQAAARWSRLERETDAGAVESRQWLTLPHELVASDANGARELGRRYLAEVGRFSRGLVRPRPRRDGVALVLLGVVTLLRFGPPEDGDDGGSVVCTYPIRGGLLVARPGGSLVVAQRPGVELELFVSGYFPRSAALPRGTRCAAGCTPPSRRGRIGRSDGGSSRPPSAR